MLSRPKYPTLGGEATEKKTGGLDLYWEADSSPKKDIESLHNSPVFQADTPVPALAHPAVSTL